jgi:hypothetical protein
MKSSGPLTKSTYGHHSKPGGNVPLSGPVVESTVTVSVVRLPTFTATISFGGHPLWTPIPSLFSHQPGTWTASSGTGNRTISTYTPATQSTNDGIAMRGNLWVSLFSVVAIHLIAA